jgi:hypothetical protein
MQNLNHRRFGGSDFLPWCPLLKGADRQCDDAISSDELHSWGGRPGLLGGEDGDVLTYPATLSRISKVIMPGSGLEPAPG